jgi:coenzyme F420-reducing hydrogenase delta subunit
MQLKGAKVQRNGQHAHFYLGSDLENADWNRRREIIRKVVERVGIGRATVEVVFWVPDGIALSTNDPTRVTFSRC